MRTSMALIVKVTGMNPHVRKRPEPQLWPELVRASEWEMRVVVPSPKRRRIKGWFGHLGASKGCGSM